MHLIPKFRILVWAFKEIVAHMHLIPKFRILVWAFTEIVAHVR